MRYVLLVLLFPFHLYATPYLCGDTGLVYDSSAFCSSVCSSCTAMTSSGTCSTSYKNYVYDETRNLTYAVTSASGTWTSFSSTAIVRDAAANTILKSILSYVGISSAWIGLYDPDKTQNLGSSDDTRFEWRDGSLLNYRNWALGQPDNAVDGADIGVVSVYGEHWVLMNGDGTWRDTGEHSGQTMSYPALVEFSGQLGCVSGELPSESVDSSDMTTAYCNGSSTCYLCTDSTDFFQCSSGTGGYLCPLKNHVCNVNYTSPTCPTGTVYNTSTDRCEKTNTYTCSIGGTYATSSACTSACKNTVAATVNTTCSISNSLVNTFIWGTGGSDNGYTIQIMSCDANGAIVHVYFDVRPYDLNNDRYSWSVYVPYNGQHVNFGYPNWYMYFSGGQVYGHNLGYADWASGDYVTANTSYSCPSGYTLSGTSCIKTGTCTLSTCPTGSTASGSLCVASASCSSGTLQNDQCFAGATCPVGSNPCVMVDGQYKCSENSCYSVSDSGNYVEDDTSEGSNDVAADGEKDESGNCLGTIYIFNGSDRRCRKPGVQTGFSDCCKKKEDWFGLAKCNPNEQLLSSLRSWGELDGQCHVIGDYCSSKFLGICVQTKKTYCCFGSPLARIIHEQGRPQLNIGWGSPKSPNCTGFTPEEFQKLDFSKISFDEWINEYVIPELNESISDNIKNTFENIALPTGTGL